jgi:hypothetical protein
MNALRQAAEAHPQADALSWSRGAEGADELCDWSLKLGAVVYKVHTAAVASGPRRSEKLRRQVISTRLKDKGEAVTDVFELIPEPTRSAILKDPYTQPTFALLLDWIYGHVRNFALPSFSGRTAVASTPVAPKLRKEAASAAAVMVGSSATTPNGGDPTFLDFFSTAIFGTPTAASTPRRQPTDPRTTSALGTREAAAGPASSPTVRPEQVPMLWQLADALQVHGLKASLAPLFEQTPLPPNYVMQTAAFERLKLLVRALELNSEELVAALCEQLRLNHTSRSALRDGMVELAVAAAACDSGRYASLVACGLLPAADPARMAELCDKSSLRVASEAQVHDLLLTHFAASKATPAAQEALWSVVRFSYLPADRLVSLSERPNVPPRWLALACAQRAAATAGAATLPTATAGVPNELRHRLKPRACYQ